MPLNEKFIFEKLKIYREGKISFLILLMTVGEDGPYRGRFMKMIKSLWIFDLYQDILKVLRTLKMLL